MNQDILEGFRLSPQQKRLWSLQHADQQEVYLVQGVVRIAGSLDTQRFAATVQSVVEQHEILRTFFQQLPGMEFPVQVIAEQSEVSLTQLDLSQQSRDEQAAAIDQQLSESRGSLDAEGAQANLRLNLMRLSSDLHLLLITASSLLMDRVALQRFVQEISRSYSAAVGEAEEAEAPLQYADIAEWQNGLLEGEDAEEAHSSWRTQNLTADLGLRLPFEAGASDSGSFRPQSCRATLDAPTLARIEALVDTYSASTATFFLACWQVLLWRLTGQAELLLGLAYDGRGYAELEEAIGPLARYVPIRGKLAADSRFGDLLSSVEAATAELSEQQDYFSWELSTEASSADKTQPFFPFCFDFSQPVAIESGDDLTFTIEQQYSYLDRFKLQLACTRQDESLVLALDYDPALFATADVQRMLDQLLTLVNNASTSPETELTSLAIVGSAERHQLLVDFNTTAMTYAANSCFQQLFAEQVARTPDAVAVVFEAQQLTYAELDVRANQLAHHLRSLNVGTEVLVGVFLERSLDLLVALLGIWKAGGAYLPLDPADPADRLAFMLADAGVPVVLTQQQLAGRLPERQGTQRPTIIHLDQAQATLTAYPSHTPESDATAQSLAYVIYTSGSTGQPKGVQIEHRSLTNYLSWVNQQLLPDAEVRLPVLTRTTFDASLKQLFAPLLRGGTVWMLPDDLATQPDVLLKLINEQNKVALNCVPSLWQAVLKSIQAGDAPAPVGRLTTLLMGGEQLSSTLIQETLRVLPEVKIWNLYGPTESTANASAAQVDDPATITIGRPLANTQIYILDERRQLQPIGVPGEIYIGGDGLARGYLKRPELTAERFVQASVEELAGQRLYRTGDRGRYRNDGQIEFLGRLDHQVKLRGLRIELGEIEAVLSQHAAVREAVVTVRGNAADDQSLVAYITLRQTTAPSTAELRDLLQQKLPSYMVPAAFVVLDALPLLPNGKLNRSALPAPSTTEVEGEDAFVAPRTALEEILVAMWGQLLDHSHVGIEQNFFALGGNSLLATQLLGRVRKVFRVNISLRSMLEATTVASLAQLILAHETQPGQVETIARKLQQVRNMSDEERQQALEHKRDQQNKG